MTDFVPFVAHTILPAAQLNAALQGVDTVAEAAMAAASSAGTLAASASTAATAATQAASSAGTLATQASQAATAATAAASAAGTLAAAALPASKVGVPNGVAPLGADSIVPAAFLPAPAAASGGGGYDAYVVFRGFATTENGVYVATGIVKSKGVSSVDDAGNGVFQINLSPPAPNANFVVSAFGKFGNDANDGTLAIICEPRRLYPASPTAPSGPTSGPTFLQVLGGYQGAQSTSQILLYRVGITFTP